MRYALLGSHFDPKIDFCGLLRFSNPKMSAIFGLASKFYVVLKKKSVEKSLTNREIEKMVIFHHVSHLRSTHLVKNDHFSISRLVRDFPTLFF